MSLKSSEKIDTNLYELVIDVDGETFNIPREKAHTGAAAREQPQDSPIIAR